MNCGEEVFVNKWIKTKDDVLSVDLSLAKVVIIKTYLSRETGADEIVHGFHNNILQQVTVKLPL